MDFRRLFDLLHYQEARFPNKTALLERSDMGWQSSSTRECIDRMNEMSAGLLEIGLKRGERAAIYAPQGSPDWLLLDLALQQIGVIVVPIHAGLSDDELTLMLKKARVRICFTANREYYEDIASIRKNILYLEQVLTFRTLPDLPSLEQYMQEPGSEHLEYIQMSRASIHEDDLVTIIFTSGTSGQPQGVCLSHKNIVSNLKSIIAIVPVHCDHRVLSFLPLSHIFERVVVYTYLAVGASVHFTETPARLFEHIKEVRPHYMTVVPLVLERVYERIIKEGKRTGGYRQRILLWAIKQGKQYNGRFRIAPLYWLKLLLADILVYRRWRRQLGGRLSGVVSGAAALRTELSRLFSAAGIEVREGYGLTEASPVVTCNRFEPGGYRFGTAGMPIPGVQVRIAEKDDDGRGQIEVKGPNIMLGYLDDNDARNSITEDGWLRTGDLGLMEDKRFLRVFGREANVFKTASGRFVAVQSIEQQLERSEYIHQTMVFGRNQPWLAAFIVPDFEQLQQWCTAHEVHWTAPEYMVYNPVIQQLYRDEIDRLQKDAHINEWVKAFELVHQPWTQEEGLLTPTFKLKRDKILIKYEKKITGLFPEEA